MDITSVFWYILSIFTIFMVISFVYLFYKDRDLRKMMFAFGLFPSIFSFIYLGLNFPPPIQPENSLLFSLYHWGTIPIIESFFFVLIDRVIYRKKEFKLAFSMFLFFYFLSCGLILSNIIPDNIFYTAIQGGTVFTIILCLIMIIRERTFSGWLFLLSICCFILGGISLAFYISEPFSVSNTMLSLSSFFLSYIFLALIFRVSTLIQEKTGLDAYFTLENQLKKIETDLYNTEQRYYQLIENINEGIWVLDKHFQTTYVNSFLSTMLGYTPGDMLGTNFFEYMQTTSKHEAEEKLLHIEDLSNVTFEFDFLRKDKMSFTACLRISSLTDDKGSSIGVIVSLQDVSERKKMEHDLGVKLDKLQKSELATLNIMEDLQNTISALTVAEAQIRDKNNELQTINSELNTAREALTVLNRDLEKKVQERTADVENLLKQKDEFINQLGHDLKTPLTPLNILIPIVKDKEQDPKQKELLNVISNNIQYMKNLVIKTLSLAKLNSSNYMFILEELNLSENVRNILEMDSTFFQGKNVNIQNNIPEDIIVQADFLQIKELFDNMLSNAVKYSQPDSVHITLDAQKKDDYVLVAIKDSGIGLDANQIDHVFDEFYKVDYSRHDLQSTGLGLSICKRIVEKHGGKIWVESQGKGKGSTFYFTLKAPPKKPQEN
jgi:PAS domain S-box-containing protein